MEIRVKEFIRKCSYQHLQRKVKEEGLAQEEVNSAQIGRASCRERVSSPV